jgi:hypothetical protein
MKTKALLFLSIAAALFSACGPVTYIQSPANVPLFKEKNNYQVTVSSNNMEGCVNAQLAATPVNHLGFMLNGTCFLPQFGGTYYEGGIGYYNQFKNKMIFECYGLYGRGDIQGNFGGLRLLGEPFDYWSIHNKYEKYSIQPSLSFINLERLKVAFTLRANYVMFDTYSFARNNVDNDLNSTISNYKSFKFKDCFIVDPMITLRAGHKVNHTLQVGYSLSDKDYYLFNWGNKNTNSAYHTRSANWERFFITFGITLDISGKTAAKEQKE